MGPFHLLAEQHRELEQRLEALDAGEAVPETWRARAEALISLLRLHARLEERHLFPLLARVGGARVCQESEDHLTLGELVDELEEQPLGAPDWWARLLALADLLREHVRFEEDETFPRLATALNEGERQALGRALATLGGGESSAHETTFC